MTGRTTEAAPSSRIWTVPNALSAARLLGVPLFLYWVLSTHQDGRAILLLMAAGASDYFDGKIARRYGQFSRLGQLLDPAADRLYILATLLALVARDGLPLWWALVLIGRDVALAKANNEPTAEARAKAAKRAAKTYQIDVAKVDDQYRERKQLCHALGA